MKTAVEWLVKQLENHNGVTRAGFEKCIQEAKEMEKEQIIDAHGNKLKKSRDTGNYEYWFSGEDYYNKTFKTN
jgi:hypothetical protein